MIISGFTVTSSRNDKYWITCLVGVFVIGVTIISCTTVTKEVDVLDICQKDCMQQYHLTNRTCVFICNKVHGRPNKFNSSNALIPTLNRHRNVDNEIPGFVRAGSNLHHINADFFYKRYRRHISDVCQTMKEHIEKQIPVLMLEEEGHTVRLKCDTCSNTTMDKNATNWYFSKIKNEQISEAHKFFLLEINGDYINVEKDHELFIESVTTKDAAEFKCISGENTLSHYRIDVVEREHRVKVVGNDIEGIHPKPEKRLEQNNIRVFTAFETESRCSRCNARGEKISIGHCMVSKINLNVEATPADIPFAKDYPKGIQCRSTLLPPKIANMDEIKYRRSETLVQYCYVPCPTEPSVQKVTDELGNVIEVVETGKGFRSMRAPKPTFPSFVKRKTVYQEQGKPLAIECPEDDAARKGIRWQNGSQPITHLATMEDKLRRVFIDVKNRLFIEHTEFYDTAPYSCWLVDRHIATIKVRIVPAYDNTDLKDKVVYVGVGLSILLLVSIGFSIFKAQRNEKH